MMRRDKSDEQVEWAHYKSWWVRITLLMTEKDAVEIKIPEDVPPAGVEACKLWANSNFMYEMDLQEFLEKTFNE